MNRLRCAHPSRWLPALAAALLLFAGCGGGVGEEGTGGGGSFAQGAINGFGSVIVNGVRYDDSAAEVRDVDGTPRSSADLRLGMTVEIEAGAVTQTATGPVASARSIRYASELLGPVSAIDLVNNRFTLLGQTVQLGAGTVFDARLAGGLAALAVGDLVEVHAAADPAGGRYRATRVEPRAAAASHRIRGIVQQLDTAARTFRIGAAAFSYAGASGVPAGIANGSFVRLQLQPLAAGAGSWTVLSFASAVSAPADGQEARLRGLVSSFTSSSDFQVNGQRVDAAAARFPDGTLGLALGVRVEVEGRVQGGVLRADEVAIDSDDEDDARGFELEGALSGLDTVARTFVLRGVLVSYASPTLRLDDGTLADLANGRVIEVKGRLGLDGITLVADEIDFTP